MIRTFVCNKEKCSGNTFNIKTKEDVVNVVCGECSEVYNFDASNYDFKYLSCCSKCNNDRFKVFRDIDNNTIYAKCNECGNPPEKIFIDSDGVQVSYEEKLLCDVKNLMQRIDQKIMNLEINLSEVEKGQHVLEQSIAYINKFIVEDR